MIIVMKTSAQEDQLQTVIEAAKEYDVQINLIRGTGCTILGLVGDTSSVDMAKLEVMDGVDKIMRVQEPFKKASRHFHPDNSTIKIGSTSIGGDKFCVIAGPCSVESEDQITSIANEVKAAGASILRGGAFKPRTSPYSFQGLEADGLDLLKVARKKSGLPIVSEIMSPKHVELFENSVDMVQVGARNMQNFDLLKELGKATKPVLLKRGLSSTIEEWLMSAEYILAAGNPNVILCERGIRTFETYTRNTLDLSAIPAIKKLSHLPIIVDPSHATGFSWMVLPLSLAAISVGADGLMIEVHNDPKHAKCDGPQSITPAQFVEVMQKLGGVAKVLGKTI